MTRTLLTGATGLVGYSIAKALGEAGYITGRTLSVSGGPIMAKR